jgi:hypothetical protein
VRKVVRLGKLSTIEENQSKDDVEATGKIASDLRGSQKTSSSNVAAAMSVMTASWSSTAREGEGGGGKFKTQASRSSSCQISSRTC